MTIPFWTLQGTVDLAALRPEDMTAEIIGNTLAKINRFGGRTRNVVSVATHSVLVESLVSDELQPWALLHDAHEAFIGDLTPPAVAYIASMAATDATIVTNAIASAKWELDRLIAQAWDTETRSIDVELMRADRLACQAEAHLLLDVTPKFTSSNHLRDFKRAVGKLVALMSPSDIGRIQSWDPWRERIDHHARHGRLTPPKALDPARMSPAG